MPRRERRIEDEHTMDRFYDFMSAALPWIAMGLLLAIFCARAESRKKTEEKKINQDEEGKAK